jgi:hypothetical protein
LSTGTSSELTADESRGSLREAKSSQLLYAQGELALAYLPSTVDRAMRLKSAFFSILIKR